MPTGWRTSGRVEYGALGFMLCAVVGYSITPLVVAFAGGNSPFLFNVGWRLGLLAGFGVFGALAFRSVWGSANVRRRLLRGLRSRAIVAAVVSNNDYALFVLAAMYVHIAVATVIFETWPLWMVLMLAFAYRKMGRYRRNVGITVAMIGLCMVGLAFVVGSQFETPFDVDVLGGEEDVFLGSVLALLGALVGSLAAFSFRWSTDLGGELAEYPTLAQFGARFGETGRRRYLELMCLLVAYGASSALCVVLSAAVGLIRGETVEFSAFAASFVGGAATYAPATVFWRLGNLSATNLGVNALIYGTPVLSLGWLFLLSLATVDWHGGIFVFEIVRKDYLAIGVLAIVAANLIINLEG